MDTVEDEYSDWPGLSKTRLLLIATAAYGCAKLTGTYIEYDKLSIYSTEYLL